MKTKNKQPKYVIIRADRAGVFAGYLQSKDGNEVTLTQARRIWQWSGAASLSQLAEDGTSDPDGCKFPKPVSQVTVFGVIEILAVTDKAKASIAAVKEWSK